MGSAAEVAIQPAVTPDVHALCRRVTGLYTRAQVCTHPYRDEECLVT